MRRAVFILLVMVLGFGLGLTFNVYQAMAVLAPSSVPLRSLQYHANELPAANLVFDAQPGSDVPTLQTLTAGATTDSEAYAMIVAYYNANKARLKALWRVDNDTRLAGIFAMYIVHISTIYGVTTYPSSFLEYLKQPRAHCGTYSIAEAHIDQALGLTWRMWELTSGWHGWIEVLVDGQWEMFDATTNQWISRSGVELLQGVPRQYRAFYTPLLDINRPDARLHMQEGYNMQKLRVELPGLGLFYNPPGEPYLSDRPSIWDTAQ